MASDVAVSEAGQTIEPLFPHNESDDRSTYAYRQLIGSLGLVFPFIILLVARWRPTPVLRQFDVLPSVSAYYYTGSVAVFVGILVALGLFLLTYQGYDNRYGRHDRVASRIAGWAAIFVAFFPTDAPVESLIPFWWRPATGHLHIGAAAILFCSFSYFSLFLFTKTRSAAGMPLPMAKRVRNSIYVFCGVVMVVCIVWTGIASVNKAPIFLPESIALISFAVSWLTKGRADRTAIGIAKRTLYYGRNPKLAVVKLYNAVRG